MLKKKGKSVYFDASKLKTENKTPHLNHMDIVRYLFLSEKKEKKRKIHSEKLRWDDPLSWG